MPIITLVTGADRGLGLALTRQLVRRGDRVIAAAREPEAVEPWDALRDPRRLHRLPLDPDDPASIETLQARIGAITDRLDLVILAGPEPDPPAGAIEPTRIAAEARAHAAAPAQISRALVELLARAEAPRLVWVAPEQAGAGTDGVGDAAIGLALRALADELADRGIVAVAVDPGPLHAEHGVDARFTPEQSAAGLLNLAADLTTDDAGARLRWNGDRHAG